MCSYLKCYRRPFNVMRMFMVFSSINKEDYKYTEMGTNLLKKRKSVRIT